MSPTNRRPTLPQKPPAPLPDYDRAVRALSRDSGPPAHIPRRLIQRIERYREDFPAFCAEVLRIRNKRAQDVPFRLKRAQRTLWDEHVKPRIDADEPARLYLLKARQIGSSTFTEALLYWQSTLWADIHALVAAHSTKASSKIFAMTQRFYRAAPEDFRPSARRSNRDEFLFAHPRADGPMGLESHMAIEVASDENLAAGTTLQGAHLSEFARYDQRIDDVDDLLATFLQAVPDLGRTFVVLETTGQGDNYAANFWRRDTGFDNIFISWVAEESYTLNVGLPEGDLSSSHDALWGDEVAVREQVIEQLETWYSAEAEDPRWLAEESLKRMAWRRHAIRNKCSQRLALFQREYPITPEEAFQSHGRGVFESGPIIIMRRQAEFDTAPAQLIWEPGQERFVPTDHPPLDRVTDEVIGLSVREQPKSNGIYAIGADVGAGHEDSDFSTAQVLRYLEDGSRRQVAVYEHRDRPMLFARILANLGHWYNEAFLVPEANNLGQAVVDELIDRLHYRRIWQRKVYDAFDGGYSAKWGYSTDARTKHPLVHYLSDGLSSSAIYMFHLRTLAQLLVYEVDDRGAVPRYSAPRGKHDDLVMALALAEQGIRVLAPPQAEGASGPEYMSLAWWDERITREDAARRRSVRPGRIM
jgi:hypothetical protein